MLRRFSKSIVPSFGAIRRSYGDSAPNKPFIIPKEINRVRLIGSVVSNQKPKRTEHQFWLKTINDNSTYCIHEIKVKNADLIKLVADCGLEDGQRVFIAGRLSTTVDDPDDRKQQGHIIAHHINLTDSMIDENAVEYMGQIVSEVVNNMHHSSFLISNNYVKNRSQDNQSNEFEANHVSVKGNELALHVARNLMKFDRVYLNGAINYHEATDKTGNPYARCSIECNNIAHLMKYRRHVPEYQVVADEAAKLW